MIKDINEVLTKCRMVASLVKDEAQNPNPPS